MQGEYILEEIHSFLLPQKVWMALVLIDEWMRTLDTQHGAMNDNEKEPVVESFDEITVEHEWNRLLLHGPQPPPRSKHAAVAVGRKMFVVGGTSSQGTLNDVQVFHAEKLTWETLPCQSDLKLTKGEQRDAHCPSCTGHSLVFWDKQFVLVGCQTGPAFKTVTVFSLDVRSRSWSILSPKGNAPCARTGHTVVEMASMLVLFGGEDMKGKTLNDIHILDLKNLLWLPLETSGSKPSPRRDHSAASYSERYLWIFGGKSNKTYFNDTYCLDFQRMEWTKGRTRSLSPMARAGHCGAIAGNRWYIVGGESRGNEISNTLAFNLESQEWAEIPNIRSQPPLVLDGVSLVKIQNKGKTFLVAFGGHDANLSNQIYLLLLPSTKQLGPFIADTPSPRSASFNSAHSAPPTARDFLFPEGRISNATSGDEDSNDSTFSLPLRGIDYRPEPNVDYFGDQEANSIGDQESIVANQVPSNPTSPNDEATYPTHKGSYNEGPGLAEQTYLAQVGEKVPSQVSADLNIKGSHGVMSTSRDLDPRNGTEESEISVVQERLLAALKDNEDLQNMLVQAKVELEQTLKKRETLEQKVVLELEQALKEKDSLEQQVYDLVTAKAEAEYQLEQSRQKLEELEMKVNPSSRLPGDSDSNSPSTSKGEQSIAKPNSLRTKLYDQSLYDDTQASYETQRRLEEAERKLSRERKLAILTESRLIATHREKRALSEEAATAKEMMEKARTDCKTLRDENLRLEHNLLAVKAQLIDAQEELQAGKVVLAQASARNSELQVEMDALSQKFSGS